MSCSISLILQQYRNQVVYNKSILLISRLVQQGYSLEFRQIGIVPSTYANFHVSWADQNFSANT